ncbi:minor capsid protein [Amycolatopsis antarctica]|uniref:minor capsid protein n=1 Tax=Amycolatopsis antarctica TaxID=1854586 RepID=UPI001F0A8EF3|nr:minor capsid protein [Amycolatopsis antarctica]
MKTLALHLASLGLVRYPPGAPGDVPPCHVVDMPDKPATAVCVYPRTSFPPDDDLSGYEWPELQVIVRTATDAGHEAGWVLAERIRLALRDTAEVTWAAGTAHVRHVFTCDANESSPLELEPQAGRRRWSVSFQIHLLTEVPAP